MVTFTCLYNMQSDDVYNKMLTRMSKKEKDNY